MTHQTTAPACELFRDDLAAVLDGDDTAIDRHLDHLSDCDQCRDLQHEAGRVIRAVGDSGADYQHTDQTVEQVLARIAGDAPAPAADNKPAPAPQQARPQPQPQTVTAPTRSSRWPALAAIGGLAAAAGIAAYVIAGDGRSGTATDPGAAIGAEVVAIDRASDDGASGLSAAGAEIAVGATVEPGAVIATDTRTRARLKLSDGSEITLNRGTEIELVDSAARTVALRAGELVAEINKLESGPNAIYQTANARVEVLGTRFLLSANGSHTSVRVSRGLVSLSSPAGSSEVRPGEEGVVTDAAAPEVDPSGELAEAMSFAELATGDGAADKTLAGIGELRAFKPGEKRDRDWPLEVEKQKVTVRIAGNVARTEIEQTFRNDSKTTLEGVYKFPLPSDAKIDRLALDVEDKFEEGAFVDKERAAKIWRGVIRRATPQRKRIRENDVIWVPGPWRDPALLEWQRGGRFELRIFPIPKKGSRTIKLAYTQVLPPQGHSRRYVYPLAYAKDGSTDVESFEVDFAVVGIDPVRTPRTFGYDAEPNIAGDTATLTYGAQGFRPAGNFIVEYTPAQADAELAAWTFRGDVAAAPTTNTRRGGLDPEVVAAHQRVADDKRPTALLALRPELPRWAEAKSRDFVFAIDTSQSMVGERFARARRLVAAAVSEMDRRDRVSVIACDVECRVLGDSARAPSSRAATEIDEWLAAIEPAGASHLGAAIERAAGLAAERRRQDTSAWVVYVGDGMASMGYRSAAALSRRAETIAGKHGVGLSAVGIGSDADDVVLGALARAGGGHFMPWKPGSTSGTAALALLETTYGNSLTRAELVLPAGLTDIGPAQLPTIRSGQEVLVAARFDGEVSGDVILRGMVGGKKYENRFPIQLKASTAAGNGFVPRMWAALRINQLELDGDPAMRPEIVGLSKAYGVLSKHTSLLVLESEAMFKAFGVDRSAPTVRWTGDEGDAETVVASGAIDFSGSGNGRGGMRKAKKPASIGFDLDKNADMAGGPPPADARAPAGEAESAPMPMRRSRRPGQWMRKVYYRAGSIARMDAPSSREIKAVATASEALDKEPNSREAHRDLVRALSVAGQLERAAEIAAKWLERDRFDPQALIKVADMIARDGDRARGLRTLSGVADVVPDNADFHDRLAGAYERADKIAAACAHRIAAAEIARDSAARIARAMRCERALGHGADADWLLSRAKTDKVKDAAIKLASEDERDRKRRGHIEIEASWLGGSDLDVSLIAPDGERISWMGGGRGVSAESVSKPNRETLAVRWLSRGTYIIEISRTDPADTRPIDGTVEIKIHGSKRTLPFSLEASDRTQTVGRARSTTRSRLVPI
jgi:ferric-dicitrate binding protein FerR (iron transport regulator)/Mg-chelatase subunit ChlD